jgi:glutamyl-tRNA synthetase
VNPPQLRLHASTATPLSLNAARSAVANADQRLSLGGTLTLALDDTRGGPVDPITRDLDWIGATPDRIVPRSERAAVYEAGIAELRRSGRLYPCFESEAELKAKAERRRRNGKADVYDREMLALTPAQRARAEANGKRPHWRFRLSDGDRTWRDSALGPRRVKLATLSDPVLVRADGGIAPALARAIDDHDLAITHLIATAINAADMATHLDLLAALGGREPTVGSLAPLDSVMAGLGGRPLRRLRADGVMAEAARAWLGREAASDLADLLALNRACLAGTRFDAVADRLPPGATEAFWLTIRDGLSLLAEAETWWRALEEPRIDPLDPTAMPGLRAALDTLPVDTALDDWAPEADVRSALIGVLDDPPPAGFWRLLGRDRIAERLRAALRSG